MDIRILKKRIVKEIEAIVSSETHKGAHYIVTLEEKEWSCSCPGHIQRDMDCKHIKEVQEMIEDDETFCCEECDPGINEE